MKPVLDNLFSTFGAPETYKTDNWSPFQSHRFMDFAKKWGFKHRRVTPEWPRANGKAESFMKKLGTVLKTAKNKWYKRTASGTTKLPTRQQA